MSNKKLLLALFLLLTISVLSSLLTYSFSLHKKAVLIAKTRVQFLELESALTTYCLEYGEMPFFLGSEELIWLNREGNSELLIKALTGKNPDGTQLSSKDKIALNPLRKNFYTFENEHFLHKKDGSIDRSVIVDAFNNPEICIIVENVMDNDVVIPKSCFPKEVQNYIRGESIKKKIAIFTISRDKKNIIGNWNSK